MISRQHTTFRTVPDVQFTNEVFDNIIDLIDSLPNEVVRVGILVSRLDNSEGAGNVALRQLRLLEEENYDPMAITFTAVEQPDGVKFEELGKADSFVLSRSTGVRLKHTFWPSSLLKIARRLTEFDLIIIHQPVFCPAAYLATKLGDTSAIYYNHHITKPWEKVGMLRKVFGYTAYKLLMFLSSQLDVVVSVSKYSRDSYAEQFGIKGPVIYNSINRELYNEEVEGAEIREKHDLGNRPVILFVGRLARSKRVHELISIYEMIHTEIPDAALLVVGRKDEKDYSRTLERQSEEVDGSITFTGVVPEIDLPKYYAAADVYATCSVKEGFNLTIAEANACETPSVAYNIGAHPEVLSYGKLVDKMDREEFTRSVIEFLL